MKLACMETEEYKALSHPVRGAWIEIVMAYASFRALTVAPREGCVD